MIHETYLSRNFEIPRRRYLMHLSKSVTIGGFYLKPTHTLSLHQAMDLATSGTEMSSLRTRDFNY